MIIIIIMKHFSNPANSGLDKLTDDKSDKAACCNECHGQGH